jgi:hypothetical protein
MRSQPRRAPRHAHFRCGVLGAALQLKSAFQIDTDRQAELMRLLSRNCAAISLA